MSPYKVRSVMALVRGKSYEEAVAILTYAPKAASTPVLKCMNSAAANAEHNLGLSKKDLFVAEIFADPGPTMKRVVPRARGSADRILKRSSHITVILDEIRSE
jgi:large subunit ribosomal protein L22